MNKDVLLPLIPLGLGVAALINFFVPVFPIPELGDGKLIAYIMANPEQIPAAKYLVGIELLRMVHAAIWQFPPLSNLLPESIAGHAGFIRIAGILVMTLSTTFLLHIYQNKSRILLVAVSPVWLLFSIGYLEFYPFIAGVFLALLCWVFQGNLEEKPEWKVGLVCGALPLVYFPFAPFCLMIVVCYLWRSERQINLTLGTLLISFLVVLRIFWPNRLAEYFTHLYQDLNWGDTNTIYEEYRGLASSQTSLFFKNEYIFSWQHIMELLQMLLLGLGILPLLLSPLVIFWKMQEVRKLTRKKVLALLVAGWSIIYMVFTIPKLGPVRDVDMFFLTYMTLAYFIGAGLEGRAKLMQMVILPLWLLSSVYALSRIAELA